MFEKENFEKDGTVENCIFKVAEILYELYLNLIDRGQNYKLYYRPAIKCQNPAHNCGPGTFDSFKEQCFKKDDIFNFTLSTSCIIGEDEENEYNDWCKIAVVFDMNKDVIEIHYLKEFKNELFDETINKIKDTLKGQKTKFNNKKRKKTIREKIDIGVLGEYYLNDFQTKEYFDNKDGYNRFFKRVMKNYAKNINLINNKIIYEIYDELHATRFPLWKYDEFYKIIDEDKLPNDFENMTDEEKSNLIYKKFDYNEKNVIEKLKENVPFFNVDKFKNDILITNITIDKKPKEIAIDFKGISDFFVAAIILDYGKKYEIIEFSAS